jgi:Tfp pilus assembly protein PilO
MTAEKQRMPRPAQFALAGLAVAVLAAAGWFLLVSPKKADAVRYEEQIAAVRREIADRRAASEVRQVRAAVKTADLFRLAKAMPDDTSMATIILELNRVAEDAGIEFESITPAGRTDAQGYQVLPIALVFQGNFYTLSDFLFRLRQLVQVRDGELSTTGRLFTVDTLSFSEDGELRFPFIRAELTIDAFVFGNRAVAPIPGVTDTSTETEQTNTDETTTTATTAQPEVAPAPSGASAAPSSDPSS